MDRPTWRGVLGICCQSTFRRFQVGSDPRGGVREGGRRVAAHVLCAGLQCIHSMVLGQATGACTSPSRAEAKAMVRTR